MSAAKQKTEVVESEVRLRMKSFYKGASRWIVIAGIVIGTVSGGAYAAWRMVATHVLAGPHYRLSSERISVTPPPAWIHRDIRAEVLRDGSLDGDVSILDDDLAQRIHKAFALHPWVAKVIRVTKQSPANVDVELVYRQPACMVEVPGGLYAVDREGVLLPSVDFTPLEARRYPRLAGLQTITAGPVGTKWQDARVAAAARLGSVLLENWDEFNFQRIVTGAPAGHMDAGADIEFELYTRRGTRVLWGLAPQPDATFEAGKPDKVSVEKLARLKKLLADCGSLEGPDGPQEIDLRSAGG
jgi:hypothetical protein